MNVEVGFSFAKCIANFRHGRAEAGDVGNVGERNDLGPITDGIDKQVDHSLDRTRIRRHREAAHLITAPGGAHVPRCAV